MRCDPKWSAPYPYLFVTPVERKDHTVARVGDEEENLGVIAYIHENKNFSVGDTVVFEKDMEYEFEIDDQKMYRMQIKNLCMKL
jgi:co-chaperonin GroES (HSP10)